ncbi:MAG TPA: 50S ribosomal protein L21 [Patescibacteria group bacterium]|nr:50S ribosomal protein L21 [Patescibacteria group bacterium]
MLAIVTISGKQYKVTVGDVILVDKIDGSAGETVDFDHVLLTSEGTKTHIGTPLVKGSTVKAKILAQEQGDKIEIRRYKQKVRYRRQMGFRAQLTRLEIVAIV